MIKNDADNIFENGVFTPEHWSAPILRSPEEAAAYFRTAAVAGRRIAAIRSVGRAYNFTRDWFQNYAIASTVYNEDPEKLVFPLIECIPDDATFNRIMLVDRPVIIEFDTGDTLAVEFDYPSELRVALNSLPADITDGEQQNIDTGILFSELIGQRILGVQVGRRAVTLPEDWPEPHGDDWREQDSLIAYILFQTEGDVGLAFEPYKDTGRVFAVGRDKKLKTIPFAQLKPALNPEELVTQFPEETE